MSTISNSVGSSLYDFFKNVSAQSASTAAPASSTTSTTGTSATSQTASLTGDDSTASGTTGATSSRPHRHHKGGGGGAELFSKIQSAVTTALQSAQSDTSADPNKVVEDAIASVLNGSAGGTSATETGANATTDPNTDATGTAAATQSFQSLLQAAGIDAKQFHSDFLAAVNDAQNGTVNPGTAFGSVPTGSVLDTVA